ncbi:PhnD/SsuA/transferrin family substrate-binding protein [Salinibius halmophilus]|uniref:PhnD/SsuA/transferrin family substrate-binding protein n=1 Tax=Salinibius halmophilus TaxID=1853216 RepID=UPI000E6616E8|nr:PhnD/SsuA/transferrin family substrate-binding protein [Salinibius halmophilus]
MFHRICITALTVLLSVTASADTIRMAVTDLVGLESLQREFGQFVETLEQKTGDTIEFYPVTNRTAAVEALRFKQVDFVMTGPAEYVVINKRTEAKIVAGFSRPDYFASVITLADSRFTSPATLAGEKVAFGSVGSTSKHLGPMQAIADYGVTPADYEPIHTKLPIAWESLKRGDVAAIGMNHLNFLTLREQEQANGGLPPGAFRVIARGPDLPNDVLMAGAHVSDEVIERYRNAFIEHSDELIAAILFGEDNQKYAGMQFLLALDDEDYNYVRAMYDTAGYPEYADFIGD